ncbi:hypothetical protein HDU79_007573 [Rhizoclosmatium sp. JEL0117]|nr:hypothetical protein HDU79_007573 [Rhizoclosmatium sp. JEL0117]
MGLEHLLEAALQQQNAPESNSASASASASASGSSTLGPSSEPSSPLQTLTPSTSLCPGYRIVLVSCTNCSCHQVQQDHSQLPPPALQAGTHQATASYHLNTATESPSLPPIDSLLLNSPIPFPATSCIPSPFPTSIADIKLSQDHTSVILPDGREVPFANSFRFTSHRDTQASSSSLTSTPLTLLPRRLSSVHASPSLGPTLDIQTDPEKKYICPYYGHLKQKRAARPAFYFSMLDQSGNGTADSEDSVCTARFKRKQEMERHVLSVHGREEEKAWVCPGPVNGVECGKRYARADALRKHLESAKCKVEGGCSFGLSESEIAAVVRGARKL